MKTIAHRIALGLSALNFVIALIMLAIGNMKEAGPFVIAFFVILAFALRGSAGLKGSSYTIVILAVVATALYYPSTFIQYRGFVFATLITPLIQLIMFGMGTSMSLDDFVGVVKTPKGVVIGICSHYLIMPSVGFALASISGFNSEIAAGMILIGCSPNGMASNVISYLAKANVALSITITAISTMLAPLLTPLLMKLLAGAFVKIDVLRMMWDILKMVIFPIAAGLVVNRLLKNKGGWHAERRIGYRHSKRHGKNCNGRACPGHIRTYDEYHWLHAGILVA
jgi:bile acid:Na+ symporter, BASS family